MSQSSQSQPFASRCARRGLARFRANALTVTSAALVCIGGLAAGAGTSAAAAPVTVWAVGDGPSPYPGTRTKEVTDFLHEQEPFNDLLWLGDVYKAPTDKVYNELYDPTYGRFANQTYPTPGNHELKSDRPLEPYDHYWEHHRPAVVGHKIDGMRSNLYAADLGNGWRLLGLTSSFIPPDSAPVAPDPPHPTVQDVLGFRHHPSKIPDYYPTTVSYDTNVNKHLVRGAQSFVVGTGGITLDYLDQPGQIFDTNFPGLERYLVPPSNSDKFDLSYYGALRLSLTRGKASYEYVKLDGSVYDAGTTTCKPVAHKTA